MGQDLERAGGPEQLKEGGEESPNPVGGNAYYQKPAGTGGVPHRGNVHLIEIQWFKIVMLLPFSREMPLPPQPGKFWL